MDNDSDNDDVGPGIHERLENVHFDDVEASGTASICCICYKNRPRVLFSPCQHLCLCLKCKAGEDISSVVQSARNIMYRPRCPLCRGYYERHEEIQYPQRIVLNPNNTWHPELPPTESFNDEAAQGTSGACFKCNIFKPAALVQPCNHLCLCKRCKAQEELTTRGRHFSICPYCRHIYDSIIEVYYL